MCGAVIDWWKTIKQNKEELFISVFIEVIIVLYFVLTDQLRFCSNDDTLKVALAGGAFGHPSKYLGYNTVHILLGYCIQALFIYFPGTNWLTIFYLIVLAISILSLHILFFSRSAEYSMDIKVLYVLVVNSYFLLTLLFFTFTIVAYTSAIVGGVAFFFAIEEKNKKTMMCGYVFIFIACLFRYMVCFSVLIILATYCLYLFLKNRSWVGIVICMVGFLLVLAMRYSNTYITCMSDVQSKYYEFVEARVNALDANALPWDQNSAALSAAGISKDAYEIIYTARFIDQDIQNTDNFNLINRLNKNSWNKYNFNVRDYIASIFGFIRVPPMIETVYKIFFWIVFGYVIVCYIVRSRLFVLAISPLLVEAIFVFFHRDLFRVTMPGYYLAMVLLLSCCKSSYFNTRFVYRKLVQGILCLINSLLILILSLHSASEVMDSYDYELQMEANTVLEYMENRQDILFFPVSSNMYALEVYRPVFDYAGENGRCFLCGGGESLSEDYYDSLSYYNVTDVEHPIFEAVDNRKMQLVGTANEETAKEEYQPILNYIRYKTGKKVQLKMLQQITNRFAIYYVISN